MFSFNTLKWIYLAVVASFTVIYTYLVLVDTVPALAYILMVDLSLWCAGTVYLTAVRNKESKLINLMDKCKIAEFIEKYSHEHAKDSKKGLSTPSTILLATAHMYLGDIETSLNLFQTVEPQNLQKVRKKQLAAVVAQNGIYHNNLSTAYIRHHDIENAKLHMEKAQEYLKQLQGMKDKKGQNKESIKALTRSLTNRELELELELGSEMAFTERIDQLKDYLDDTEPVLKKVYYHYLLSVLYTKTGNTGEADRCREYVRENGGDTCYVQWVEI